MQSYNCTIGSFSVRPTPRFPLSAGRRFNSLQPSAAGNRLCCKRRTGPKAVEAHEIESETHAFAVCLTRSNVNGPSLAHTQTHRRIRRGTKSHKRTTHSTLRSEGKQTHTERNNERQTRRQTH